MEPDIIAPLSLQELRATASGGGEEFPDPPAPSSFNHLPPVTTAPWVVGTTPEKFLLWWDSDHSDGHQWIAGPPAPGPIPGTNGNTNSFYGPFPEYVVTYRRFWQRMDPQLIMAGRGPAAGYTRSVMVTQGMSTTNSTSLSAEMGVEAGGLSAKLSATFETSITVSDETTLQKTWNLPAGESGKNTVFILWQLVDEIVGLQPDGSVVGGWSSDTCGANINLPIPPELAAMGMGAPAANGATSIPTPRVIQPTEIYVQQTTAFDPS